MVQFVFRALYYLVTYYMGQVVLDSILEGTHDIAVLD